MGRRTSNAAPEGASARLKEALNQLHNPRVALPPAHFIAPFNRTLEQRRRSKPCSKVPGIVNAGVLLSTGGVMGDSGSGLNSRLDLPIREAYQALGDFGIKECRRNSRRQSFSFRPPKEERGMSSTTMASVNDLKGGSSSNGSLQQSVPSAPPSVTHTRGRSRVRSQGSSARSGSCPAQACELENAGENRRPDFSQHQACAGCAEFTSSGNGRRLGVAKVTHDCDSVNDSHSSNDSRVSDEPLSISREAPKEIIMWRARTGEEGYDPLGVPPPNVKIERMRLPSALSTSSPPLQSRLDCTPQNLRCTDPSAWPPRVKYIYHPVKKLQDDYEATVMGAPRWHQGAQVQDSVGYRNIGPATYYSSTPTTYHHYSSSRYGQADRPKTPRSVSPQGIPTICQPLRVTTPTTNLYSSSYPQTVAPSHFLPVSRPLYRETQTAHYSSAPTVTQASMSRHEQRPPAREILYAPSEFKSSTFYPRSINSVPLSTAGGVVNLRSSAPVAGYAAHAAQSILHSSGPALGVGAARPPLNFFSNSQNVSSHHPSDSAFRTISGVSRAVNASTLHSGAWGAGQTRQASRGLTVDPDTALKRNLPQLQVSQPLFNNDLSMATMQRKPSAQRLRSKRKKRHESRSQQRPRKVSHSQGTTLSRGATPPFWVVAPVGAGPCRARW